MWEKWRMRWIRLLFRCTDTNKGAKTLEGIHHHGGVTAPQCVCATVRGQLSHGNTALCRNEPRLLQKVSFREPLRFCGGADKIPNTLPFDCTSIPRTPSPLPRSPYDAGRALTAANCAPIFHLSQTLTGCLTSNVWRGGLDRGSGASTSAGVARITSTMIAG